MQGEILSFSPLSVCLTGSIVTCFMKAGLLESNGKGEESNSAITDLCTILGGTMIAVAIQRKVIKPSLWVVTISLWWIFVWDCCIITGQLLDFSLQGVVLLTCDLSARTLSVAKVHSLNHLPGISSGIVQLSGRTDCIMIGDFSLLGPQCPVDFLILLDLNICIILYIEFSLLAVFLSILGLDSICRVCMKYVYIWSMIILSEIWCLWETCGCVWRLGENLQDGIFGQHKTVISIF